MQISLRKSLPSSTSNHNLVSEAQRLSKINVVHVTPVYKPAIGGVGTIVHNLAKMTTRSTSAQVSVLFCDSEWRSRERKCWQDGAINVFQIRTAKIWFARIPIGISSHLAEAHIVHIHDPFFSPVALAAIIFARRGATIIMSTHGGFFHTRRWMLLKLIYFYSVCRGLSFFFSAIVAVSKQDLKRFHAISRRVVLIENGVEVERFLNNEPLPSFNKFLFIGRLSKNKNIEGLIDVFINLRKRRSDVTLSVVGQDDLGVWAEAIAPKLAELPNIGVNYHGSLDDDAVVDMMKRTKFFIFASSFEGFGIAVVEAMAAGRIPIVSDIASMRDLIIHNESGFLVDFADTEHAAAAIDEILRYPAAHLERIAGAARAASRRFSWTDVGGAYIDLYEKCLPPAA